MSRFTTGVYPAYKKIVNNILPKYKRNMSVGTEIETIIQAIETFTNALENPDNIAEI